MQATFFVKRMFHYRMLPMPNILPVKWLHPLSLNAGKVICSTEEMSLEAAKEMASLNPLSFVQMLVPDIQNDSPGETRKEQSFLQIKENLAAFLKQGILIRDQEPAIYIYRLTRDKVTYTGIWTCTSIADFANNNIKAHETTRTEREGQLADYFGNAEIDANPILVTYPGSESIDQHIFSTVETRPQIEFMQNEDRYQLWRISESDRIKSLMSEISVLKSAYIADGHHRVAAALRYSRKMEDQNSQRTCFSTVYMAHDQLRLYSFNRLISGLADFDAESLLEKIGQTFEVLKYDRGSLDLHEISLYAAGFWHKLKAKPFLYHGADLVNNLDVSLLHNHVLKPIFDIDDPNTDKRITFISGKHPIGELEERVNSGDYQIAFVLSPPSISSLFQIADSGEKMPAKSTSFEPKFPAGLLIHQLEETC